MKLAVIGARGQVGSEIVRAAADEGMDVVKLDREACDVTDADSVRAALERNAPLNWVVNTAAFHRVDECEAQPEMAVATNARGEAHVARSAHALGAAVVYISTDYVFAGDKTTPYVESDAPGPLNVYGMTKQVGEALTLLADQRNIVARISSVFGHAGSRAKGGNFVDTMLARAKAGERPRVADDLIMSPTSAADASRLLVQLMAGRAKPGIYHLSNAGACTWFEFANAIFELAGLEVRAEATQSSFGASRARRPKYSALASERLAEATLTARPWRQALADYISSGATPM